MNMVDALRHTIRGGLAVRPGLSIGFQIRGAGGSVWAVDRDPARPERYRELPAAPNNIRHLLADDWRIEEHRGGQTLRSAFPDAFVETSGEAMSLSQLFGLTPEQRMRLGDV